MSNYILLCKITSHGLVKLLITGLSVLSIHPQVNVPVSRLSELLGQEVKNNVTSK